MYEEFRELYMEMKSELLDIVRCKPLVLSRLKDADDQEKPLRWLRLIRASDLYKTAKQRYKEVDADRYTYYKMRDLLHLPEIGFRRRSFKELKQLWETTMPEVVRRKEGSGKKSEISGE